MTTINDISNNTKRVNKRARLIAMRECLRQVQKLLPVSRMTGTQFICIVIGHTTCSDKTKADTDSYVTRALDGHFTFNSCMDALNPGRGFGCTEIMTLRRKFIDILCHRINVELAQLGE